MTKHGIIDDFEAYSEWRKQVRNVIKKYRDVARAEDLTNANSEQRLNQIISTLNDDKLYIAFVAEFSRGKSELINAILATEDRRFYTHPSVDLKGIIDFYPLYLPFVAQYGFC